MRALPKSTRRCECRRYRARCARVARRVSARLRDPQHPGLHVAPNIAKAVAQAAIASGVARADVDPQEIADNTYRYIYESQAAAVPPPTETGKRGSLGEQAVDLRRRYRGVLEVKSKLAIKDAYTLAMYLPPINSKPHSSFTKMPAAYMNIPRRATWSPWSPMEPPCWAWEHRPASRPAGDGRQGRAVQHLAGVEAFPICLTTQDVDEIVAAVTCIAPTFGGINLEDIAAPRCFAIEAKLRRPSISPSSTTTSTAPPLSFSPGFSTRSNWSTKNCPKSSGHDGSGAAGIAVTKMLLSAGIQDIILCDTRGAVYEGRPAGMNWIKDEMALVTNRERLAGSLADVWSGGTFSSVYRHPAS